MIFRNHSFKFNVDDKTKLLQNNSWKNAQIFMKIEILFEKSIFRAVGLLKVVPEYLRTPTST